MAILAISESLKRGVFVTEGVSYFTSTARAFLKIARAIQTVPTSLVAIDTLQFDMTKLSFPIPSDAETLAVLVVHGMFPGCKVFVEYDNRGLIGNYRGAEYRVWLTAGLVKDDQLSRQLEVPGLNLYSLVPGRLNSASDGIIRNRDQSYRIICAEHIWRRYILSALVSLLGASG